MLKKYIQNLLKNRIYTLVLTLGVLTWSMTMIKSGIVYSYGLGFWGPNGHDGIWHIALAESLSKGSWQMPVFAGEMLKNYHIGFDLLLAVIHKITFIPIINLYFQILPPVFALLIGVLAYSFVFSWTNSKLGSLWSLFFIFFGGGLGFVVTLFNNGQFGGESIFWSQQSISTLVNPPFALSLVIIFAGLLCLDKGLKTNDKRFLIVSTFLFGFLVQIKVYAGILIIFGLFVSGIWNMILRKGSNLFKVFTGALIISVLIFSSLSQSVSSTIVFRPFWFLENMMSAADHFYWPKFAEAMINYKAGGYWLKGLLAYGSALLIFTIGNFGTRVLSLFWLLKKGLHTKNYQYIDVLVITVIAVGFIIPIFFVQSGTPWNTIQFMYYSLIFSGVLSGIWLGELLDKNTLNNLLLNVVTVLIVLLTIPTTIGTLSYSYLPGRPPSKISREEFEALRFLKDQPQGVVLTQPFDRDAANKAANNPPRPLYLYESSAYVSAFTGKPTYLEDEVNLNITGYDWQDRRSIELNIFTNEEDSGFEVLKANIKYIYLLKDGLDLNITSGNYQKIFDNENVVILKID